MQMYKIEDVKEFMSLLFLKENFDKFCVGSVELKTVVPISIHGNLQLDWLNEEERALYEGYEYVPWKLLRPMVFSLIKGKQTPQMMRIQFVHYFDNDDCGGLRIQYENGELTCISMYTASTFTLDKSNEQMWDDHCNEFLKKNRIVSTHL